MSDGPRWWRFTGIAGFKQFMPDRIIRAAKAKGHKWTRWYEPVCENCHPGDETPEPVKVAEVETRHGDLIVTRMNGRYTISVGGVVRHPNLSADSAVGAMAHYLHGAEWALMKAAK